MYIKEFSAEVLTLIRAFCCCCFRVNRFNEQLEEIKIHRTKIQHRAKIQMFSMLFRCACCENPATLALVFVHLARKFSLQIRLDLPCFAQGTARTLYIKAVAAIATERNQKTRQMKKKCKLARTYEEYNLFRNQTPHATRTTWKKALAFII